MNDTRLHVTHLHIATYLIVKGIPLLNIREIEGTKRKIFVFPKNKQTDELLKIYNFGEKDHYVLRVDIREVFKTFRELKERLYSL